MLIKDIMTKNIVTISSDTSLGDAKKIMKEHKLRRIPVVDKGKLAGIVTEERLERVSPSSTAPLLWQVSYLISHTKVKDIINQFPVVFKEHLCQWSGVCCVKGESKNGRS